MLEVLRIHRLDFGAHQDTRESRHNIGTLSERYEPHDLLRKKKKVTNNTKKSISFLHRKEEAVI